MTEQQLATLIELASAHSYVCFLWCYYGKNGWFHVVAQRYVGRLCKARVSFCGTFDNGVQMRSFLTFGV